ncbi:MAG: hypothetical protein COA52_18035 [Hyphomicrobiales bacterium]|nr:MAG: hypothetical protein COA52_18035 [Hyphomicrobiales bacterium]
MLKKLLKIEKKIFRKIQQTINIVLRPIGLSLVTNAERSLFTLHEYKKPDGSFNYQEYKDIQEAGNLKKIAKVAVQKSTIVEICDFLKSRIEKPEFGLCHGTRRGMEQLWFSQNLDCEVLGTEISKSATDFPNTVQWDFHEKNDDWLGRADFVYSNSFDHSYDPQKSLNAWLDQLKIGGFVFIEHNSSHVPEKSTAMDPFGAVLIAMPYLLHQWAPERFVMAPTLIPSSKDGTEVNVFCLKRIT